MVEFSNEWIFEVLKQIQHRLDRVDSKVDELKSEMNALRQQLVSVQQDNHNICSRQDVQLERIARRLEISDAPTST